MIPAMGIFPRIILILVDASLSNLPPALCRRFFFWLGLQNPTPGATEKLSHLGKSALDAFLQCK